LETNQAGNPGPEETMISPTRTEYLKQIQEGRTVPVRTVIPADLETPVSVFIKLKPKGAAFLFESVERGVQMGRHSFIGFSTGTEISLIDGTVTTRRAGDTDSRPVDPTDPLGPVRDELKRSPLVQDPDVDLPPPFGGAVGYIGFDIVQYFENISLPSGTADDLPDYRFMFPRSLVVFDHVKSEIEILTLPPAGDAADSHEAACAEIESLLAALNEPLPAAVRRERTLDRGGRKETEHRDTAPVSSFDRETFTGIVAEAQEYILSGDAFQVVLSQRLSGETAEAPFQIYRALRILNPSPYLFFLDFGDFQLVGSSPEMLVRLTDGTLQVNPIAGTRPRGANVAADNQLADDLLADEKERAEHVMLVDLGRNDLGRVCRIGTVKVDDFMNVERYSHVMHLVSRVSGRLMPGLDMFDALQATFPAGTVSGAPKIRAMEILSELEGDRRGPYAGAVGYFGQNGDMDMCITIRTLLLRDGKYSVQAGAGIVADSHPDREYQETLDKARALTRAVRIAEEGL
jgi:anthranilate synthase component 1